MYMYIGRVPCLSAAKFSQNYAQVRVMCLQPSKQAYQEVLFIKLLALGSILESSLLTTFKVEAQFKNVEGRKVYQSYPSRVTGVTNDKK
jgi:hypothetical protein